MGAPEPPGPGRASSPADTVSQIRAEPPRYGRYVLLLVLLILIAIAINTLATKPNGDAGVAPGAQVPPFAVPLALGNLPGDANVATGAGQGERGAVPACSVRGPEVLNICELYETSPVVLALFVDSSSCPEVLSQLQRLVSEYPQVRFAGVAIKGETAGVRKLIHERGLTFPVGLDRDGALAALYSVASCPQVSFIRRGGTAQGRAMLAAPSEAQLRERVAQLAATAHTGSGG